MPQKIIWGNFGPDSVTFVVSVDGVHFLIKEPCRKASSSWYSHKFNGPGLVYKVALLIHVNQVAWITGPFPASKNDLTIF